MPDSILPKLDEDGDVVASLSSATNLIGARVTNGDEETAQRPARL